MLPLPEEKFQKKKGSISQLLLLPCRAAGGLQQLNLNAQVQSVCSRCEVSDVINFRLGSVITSSISVLAALRFGKN